MKKHILNIFTVVWKKIDHDNKKIFVGFITVFSFIFLGKIFGALKEMAIAWQYGVSQLVDAYVFILNLVNLPISLFFSILSVVLIPLINRVRNEDPKSLPVFRAQLLAASILFGMFCVIIINILVHFLLKSHWLTLPDESNKIALQILPYLSMLIFIGIFISLYSVWTMSKNRHMNTMLEGIPAISTLIAILLFNGLEVLVWGVLIGTFIQLLILLIPFILEKELEWPNFNLNSKWWRPFINAFGIMAIGQALMSLSSIVDQFFAINMPEGTLSSLTYANKILALLLGLGATAISRVTLPIFSQGVNSTKNNKIAVQWMKILFLVGSIGAFICFYFSQHIVALLFQHGQFTEENTYEVSVIFRYGLIQLPFYFAAITLVSLHSSKQNYRLLLVTGMTALIIKLSGNYLLVPVYGVNALMISSALVYIFNVLLLLWSNNNEKTN